MLELARRMGGEPEIVVGYRNSDTFLTDDLKAYGNLTIASDDGSIGTKGTVIDAIRETVSRAILFMPADLHLCFVA